MKLLRLLSVPTTSHQLSKKPIPPSRASCVQPISHVKITCNSKNKSILKLLRLPLTEFTLLTKAYRSCMIQPCQSHPLLQLILQTQPSLRPSSVQGIFPPLASALGLLPACPSVPTSHPSTQEICLGTCLNIPPSWCLSQLYSLLYVITW